jgi:hypothetical protein
MVCHCMASTVFAVVMSVLSKGGFCIDRFGYINFCFNVTRICGMVNTDAVHWWQPLRVRSSVTQSTVPLLMSLNPYISSCSLRSTFLSSVD